MKNSNVSTLLLSSPRTIGWLLVALLLFAGVATKAANEISPSNNSNVLMEGRGKQVSFPTSCDRSVQPQFDAALAGLHSFWYSQSLKEFTAIAEAKPDCAMAYWGVAMSLWNQIWAPPRADNLEKGHQAIEKAKAVGQKTPREQAYIDALAAFYDNAATVDHRSRALAYTQKMEQIYRQYGDDREAAIFYALALQASADPLDKFYKNQLKSGQILEKMLAEVPDHPGASHYIIHAYDYPALVDRALEAALKYSVCVTIVPHAIHMPSHTYVLLGRWRDVITANNSAQEAEQQRGTPEDRLHDLDYLVYAHLQLGQDVEAKRALELALAIEDDLVTRKQDSGLRSRPFGIAAMEARWTLERSDWAGAAALPARSSRYPYADAVSRFARAIGFARGGHPDQAVPEISRLAELQKTLADAKNLYWARQVDVEHKIASSWVAHALQRDEEAVALMEAAAKAEEDSETHDTLSPGPIGMSAHEALGQLLLEVGRPNDAFKAFEASLGFARNRSRSYAGAAKAAAAANNDEGARLYYAKLVEMTADVATERTEVKEARAFMQRGGK